MPRSRSTWTMLAAAMLLGPSAPAAIPTIPPCPASGLAAAAVAAPGDTACAADVDIDGDVDVDDLVTLLGDWGLGSGTSDFTGPRETPDGVVDVYDLVALISA